MITEEQMNAYYREGYAILDDVIPPERLVQVQKSYEETIETALGLGRAKRDGGTGFLQGHRFQNPHHPWDITESMHQLYRDPDVDFPPPLHSNLEVSAADHQEVRRNFAAMVEHLDQCLGCFVERLEERGELDNTLIVFSSDHGEMLGDYSQWQKLSPLQASVGVPLMIAGPGAAPARPRPPSWIYTPPSWTSPAWKRPPTSTAARCVCSWPAKKSAIARRWYRV